MNIDHEQLAITAWDTYARAVGGKAFNGDPLPTWEEMAADPKKMVQTEAWRRTATAVANSALGTVAVGIMKGVKFIEGDPEPKVEAPNPATHDIPVISALTYAEQVLRKMSEEMGVAYNIYPAKSRKMIGAAENYTLPDHLPVHMWVHVEIEPETDGQKDAVNSLLKHLRDRGIYFDTGEGFGSWDWEWDWSFRRGDR